MEKNKILKKCREFNCSNDTLYYLIYKKEIDTYAIIGSPCNYLYQNDKDQFFGSCIYMSENNISDAMACDFPVRKKLFGIPMVKTAVREEKGKLVSLDNRQVRELPVRHRLDSVPRFESAFIPAYTCYECEDVIDIIEPKRSREILYNSNGDFRSFLSALTKRFEITPEQVGLTGSVALGADSFDDYDIIFYGDADELQRINGILKDINRIQGVPELDGFPIPFRMIFDGRIVDTIFVYDPPMLEGIHKARRIKTDVDFRCRVTDDMVSLQAEPYFQVDGEDFSSLIIAETFFHAVIRKGDVIEGRGDILQWDHNGKTESVMLCRDPFIQLTDFTRYFYRNEWLVENK